MPRRVEECVLSDSCLSKQAICITLRIRNKHRYKNQDTTDCHINIPWIPPYLVSSSQFQCEWRERELAARSVVRVYIVCVLRVCVCCAFVFACVCGVSLLLNFACAEQPVSWFQFRFHFYFLHAQIFFPFPPFSSFDISSDFVFVFWLFFFVWPCVRVIWADIR